MFNKKAITPYVSIVLLLLVSILAFSVMYKWLIAEGGEKEIILSEENIKRTLKVIRVEGNTLYLQNNWPGNITVGNISINGVSCAISSQVISQGLTEIGIGVCTQGLNASQVYTVAVFTNKGVIAEPEYLFSVVTNGLIFNYNIGACDFSSGYIKLFGLSGLNNSHLENSTSSLYSYNACAKHTSYTLGVSGSGNYINLGYLVNSNNSMFFTSQANTFQPVSNWHNLTVSSSGGTFEINITPVSLGSQNYSCIGKFDRDNTYGAHFGDCYSSHNTTIWIKLN